MLTKPEQANFKEIGPENDVANFLSIHLTKPYSVNMAEPKQNQVAFNTGKTKTSEFLMLSRSGSMRTLPERLQKYVMNR